MIGRHYKLTPEPLSEEARKILTGGRDEMIRDATERAARISDSTHQGHAGPYRWYKVRIVEPHLAPTPLEQEESKFEAGIQDIIGLLIDAEGLLEGVSEPTAWQRGDLRQAIGLLSDVRRKLVALAKEEAK